jgi:transcriptional regulator with XRE-family HTH domain
MLADNIKKFRKQLTLSQEELARKAGITYSTLIKLESGVNKNPTVKTLQQLAGALEVSLDRLVEGDSPSK